MLEVRQVENQRELRIRVRPAILRFSFRRRAPAIKASRRIHRYIAITGFAALRQGLIRVALPLRFGACAVGDQNGSRWRATRACGSLSGNYFSLRSWRQSLSPTDEQCLSRVVWPARAGH